MPSLRLAACGLQPVTRGHAAGRQPRAGARYQKITFNPTNATATITAQKAGRW